MIVCIYIYILLLYRNVINVIRRRRVEIFIIEMNLDSFKNLSNLISFDFFSKLRYEFLRT